MGVARNEALAILCGLSDAGLAEEWRSGEWLLDLSAVPESLASEVSPASPAYVSGVSALYLRGIIDQVPSEVHVVSEAPDRVVATSRGAFRLHSMPARLVGGFSVERGVPLASPEKALFDWAYAACASGRPDARLPEADWPEGFSRDEVGRWLAAVDDPRLREDVAAAVERRLVIGRR
jgi:predicted transcriptional regulator of viral defense system